MFVLFLMLLSSCRVVAALFVAELTNAGVTDFVAEITLYYVVSGLVELLLSFLHARLSAAAVIKLSSPVFRCCFSALLHVVRSAARPSQGRVLMSTAFISITQTSLYRT